MDTEEIQTAVSRTQTSLPPVPHQPPNMKRGTRKTKTRRTQRLTLWIPWRPLTRSSKASSRHRPKRRAGTPSRVAISSRLWRIRRPWRRPWICSLIRRACYLRMRGWGCSSGRKFRRSWWRPASRKSRIMAQFRHISRIYVLFLRVQEIGKS
jgi:hypothetical protein